MTAQPVDVMPQSGALPTNYPDPDYHFPQTGGLIIPQSKLASQIAAITVPDTTVIGTESL